MKVQPQHHDRLNRIVELVRGLGVCMLTTQSDEGRLQSRPMVALEIDADGHFWFFTSARSAKAQQLDRVNVSFSDEERGSYVSVCGHGELVHDAARIHALWSPEAKTWFAGGRDDPDLTLLKVTTDVAEYWDASDNKMVRSLAKLASNVLGRPVGTGEHEVITNPSREAVTAEAGQRAFIAE